MLFKVCDRKYVSVIQESVDIAARWTVQNYMKINSGKSKKMIISYAQDGNVRNNIPNIKIEGMGVDKVDRAKLLGVTISQDLTWNKHVENIVKTKPGKDYVRVVAVTTKPGKDYVRVVAVTTKPGKDYVRVVAVTTKPGKDYVRVVAVTTSRY